MAPSTSLRLISDDDVEKYAAFELDIHMTNPLNDPRFGSAGSMLFDCPTCNASENSCLGHCAMLSLNCDIFHPLVYTKAVKILNEICQICNTKHLNKNIQKCHMCNSQLQRDYYISFKSWPCAVMIKSENTFDHNKRTMILPNKVKNNLPAGYVISKILVPPVSMRTPYDTEWPSALHQNYQQIIHVIKYQSSNETDHINRVSLKYQKIVGSNKSEGIIGMLGSKNGIFRQIMQGKRIENCARAVIAPDPCIEIDEIAVPRVIAEKITIEVLVTNINISDMRMLAQNEQLWWREDCLAHPRHVLIGMRFRKALKNGDYALFNRQPSLSRSSLLCFRVRIRNDNFNTFGVNPQAVSPFNADFDGDEMNIVFGRSTETYQELEDKCHISKNVIIDGRVELAPVQDVITGCYMMSLEDVPVSEVVAHQCEMYYNRNEITNYISNQSFNKNFPAISNWADNVEEPQIVTTYSLLRACISEYKNDEKITKKYLLNVIKQVHNPLEFLQRLQTIVLIWLSGKGLSVPLSSLTIKSKLQQLKNNNVIEYQQHCKDIVQKELKLSHVMCMIDSGAKGNIVHLQHMAVSLGQQIVLGKRGVFCENSYVTGLTLDEFFGHQMAAREGVVKTGVSTAESGYLNRKSCKVIADVRVQPNNMIGDDYIISTFNTNTQQYHPTIL